MLPPDHGNRSKCKSACQNKELKLSTRQVRNHNLGSSSRRGRRVLYALGAVDSRLRPSAFAGEPRGADDASGQSNLQPDLTPPVDTETRGHVPRLDTVPMRPTASSLTRRPSPPTGAEMSCWSRCTPAAILYASDAGQLARQQPPR